MYIFIFLHQTTTVGRGEKTLSSCISLYSYIKPQRNHFNAQVANSCISLYSYIKPQRIVRFKGKSGCCISLYSYIKPQLLLLCLVRLLCCISLYSYIKPQQYDDLVRTATVVYLYIPTSNHNALPPVQNLAKLYIFIFLHQTTTYKKRCPRAFRCISLYSYIKPQLTPDSGVFHGRCISLYSYIKPQRTVNDDKLLIGCISLYSYIKPQLAINLVFKFCRCISLYSYIKPQPSPRSAFVRFVVYLYIPTSNHNALPPVN